MVPDLDYFWPSETSTVEFPVAGPFLCLCISQVGIQNVDSAAAEFLQTHNGEDIAVNC